MIMKTLSNNRGISLVILVIAMTLIAVLGASFVSLVGSKHKSSLYQLDSYRALNIANAGVEYAIRYVSDELGNASSSSNYFQTLPTTFGNSNFSGGMFSATRYFSYTDSSDYIEVTGVFPSSSPVSSRKIKLTNFRRYLSAFTLVSDPSCSARLPYKGGVSNNQVIIPIMNNYQSNAVVVDKLFITIDFSVGGNPMTLSKIYLAGSQVYSGSDVFNQGNPSRQIDISNQTVPRTDSQGTISTCVLEFQNSISETHSYTVKFDFYDTSIKSSVIVTQKF